MILALFTHDRRLLILVLLEISEGCVILALFTHYRGLLILVLLDISEGCVILALFTHDKRLLILVQFRDIRGLCDTGSVHT